MHIDRTGKVYKKTLDLSNRTIVSQNILIVRLIYLVLICSSILTSITCISFIFVDTLICALIFCFFFLTNDKVDRVDNKTIDKVDNKTIDKVVNINNVNNIENTNNISDVDNIDETLI